MHIYIHIPFCRRKCRYCAFYSVPSRVNDGYIPALVNEIRFYSQIYDIFSGDYDTLYIGGGTPSLLSADQISEVVSSVKRYFRLSPAEFTVEVNPESFTRDFADAILSLGANRVSIGVQSFFDDDLRFLGRIHSAEQSRRAIEIAKTYSFPEISVDIIYAIPGMTPKKLLENLKIALEYGVVHISMYALTPEEGTPLWQDVRTGKVALPGEDAISEQYLAALKHLSACGFVPYEVSNFALPGHFCRHNIAYWEHRRYIGLGASAHSFSGKCRWANLSDVEKYVRFWLKNFDLKIPQNDFNFCRVAHDLGLPIDFCEELTDGKIAAEKVMLGLRTMWGVNLADLGKFAEPVKRRANALIHNGILIYQGERIWLNPEKRLLTDKIALELVQDFL